MGIFRAGTGDDRRVKMRFEKALRSSFPADRQRCPDLRLGLAVVLPCRDFAAADQTARGALKNTFPRLNPTKVSASKPERINFAV